MATIATLTIDLVGKSAKLNAELKKANKNTKSWANQTRQMVGTSAKALAGFGAVGVAAFASIYAKNAEFMDQQAKTADRLGITTEALTGLHHAASVYGATSEEVNKSLQRMQQGLGQVAQTGTGEAKYALDGLGLSIEEIQHLKPEEQFKLISDRLQDVESQSEKVYIAQALMGKSGAKMINLMNEGSETINQYMLEAEQLGLTFSRIDAAKVEMANDAFDRAKKTTHSFGQALATETAPLIAALSDMWTDSAKEAGGFGQVAQNVVTKVGQGIGFLGDMGRGLQVVFMLMRQAIAEVGNQTIQMFNSVYQAGGGFLEYIGMDIESADTMQMFADSFSDTTDSLANDLQNLLNEPMPSDKVQAWVENVQETFQAKAEEQAKKKPTDLTGLLIGDENQTATKLDKKAQADVDRARNTYQQIFDAQLEMEGKEVELAQRKHERQIAKMEADIQLLRDKNLATQEIEKEHRLALEQLEAQHLDNISSQKIAAEEKVNSTISSMKMQVASDSLALIEQNAKEGSALQKAAFLASKAVAIAQAYINTELAAISAMAPPPIGVGPIAGAPYSMTIRALGYTSIGLMAAQSIGSFDGGGYTGDGARIGGLDGKGGMWAVVHPQETIVDHTKGQSLGNNVVINVIEDASRAGGRQSRKGLSGEDVIDIFVSNILDAGKAAATLEQTYGLQRSGF